MKTINLIWTERETGIEYDRTLSLAEAHDLATNVPSKMIGVSVALPDTGGSLKYGDNGICIFTSATGKHSMIAATVLVTLTRKACNEAG